MSSAAKEPNLLSICVSTNGAEIALNVSYLWYRHITIMIHSTLHTATLFYNLHLLLAYRGIIISLFYMHIFTSHKTSENKIILTKLVVYEKRLRMY